MKSGITISLDIETRSSFSQLMLRTDINSTTRNHTYERKRPHTSLLTRLRANSRVHASCVHVHDYGRNVVSLSRTCRLSSFPFSSLSSPLLLSRDEKEKRGVVYILYGLMGYWTKKIESERKCDPSYHILRLLAQFEGTLDEKANGNENRRTTFKPSLNGHWTKK